uniref:Ig-like domain-containing protein n=1 Tax=Sus scrofa TaxID=9823 RepID=A0A8D1TNT9_PIG
MSLVILQKLPAWSGACSLSQAVLTLPPSLSASPGASARLPYILSSDISVGRKVISWFQQNPGSPPWYLLSFYSDSDKHQSSGVPSHFSGAKDALANVGLLISGLQPEDEADYYCAMHHGSGSSYHFPNRRKKRKRETHIEACDPGQRRCPRNTPR